MKTRKITRKKFFEHFLLRTKHDLELRALPAKARIFTRDIVEMERFVCDHLHENVYIGVYTRQGGGTKEHVREVTCYFADLDAKDYKGGKKEAMSRLSSFERKPSIVIDSGNGYHAYWFLDKPIKPSDKTEATLRGIARALGADTTVADLARVMRVPGTFNYKKKPRKPVSINVWRTMAYDSKVFDKFQDEGRILSQKNETLPLEEIVSRCSFLQHCYEHRKTLSEPLWYAMVSNLARLSPGGLTLVHQFSEGHPKYKRRETDDKILQAMNNAPPHLCSSIKTLMKDSLSFDCGKNCGVASPVVLLNRKIGIKQQREHESIVEILSAADLVAMDLPEPQWIIPDLLPEGLTLLCGKPKVGKSFLCLNIAISLAEGGKVLEGIDVKKTAVLYLALEDNKGSIKTRMKRILTSMRTPPDNLYISTKWQRSDMGGLDALRDELDKHRNIKLVIVDTLQRVRPPQTDRKTLYEHDYQALEGLKTIADERRIAIVVVHHLRKTSSDDLLDEVSGTTGLTGAADNVMTLKRNKNRSTSTLSMTGRNIEDEELTLSFDGLSTRWRLVGDVEEYRVTQERKAILDMLHQEQQPWSPKQIAKRLDKKENNVQFLLGKMVKDGQVTKVSRGKYAYLSTHNTHHANNAHNAMNEGEI